MLEEGYSNSYAARVRTFLSQILNFAEAEGLVARNVARLSRTRSFAPEERDRLTKSEVVALVEAARGDRLEALVVLLATLGLRPGESTGLVWEDVDLDGGTVTICRSLKRHSCSHLRGPAG
jgi:integrase